jgi:glycosyltransferase involved in cell wall biosynthesis
MSQSSVFLLCEYATLNGGERSMLSTLDGVRAAGFTPSVMAPPHGPLAEALAARGVELLPFSCRGDDGQRLPQNRLREALAAMLRRRRPALLHANSLAMGRLSGPVAAELGLASLSHLRDIVKLSARAVEDVNRHARLLAVSPAVREFHVAGGLAAEKVHVLYNGVDLSEFRPQPPTGYLHRELGLPTDIPLIGTIGQIGLRKGQDVLLRAATRIADHAPDVHYLIIGERNSEKDESRHFERELHDVADADLSGRVHFLGVRDDVCRLLSELTLLVHPARQEPLGRVLLEAAAAGVAVVATNVGGTPEIFPPESNSALLVAADDDHAMGEAILTLLGDSTLRQRLASAARRRAEEQFDVQMSVSRLIEHYRVVM